MHKLEFFRTYLKFQNGFVWAKQWSKSFSNFPQFGLLPPHNSWSTIYIRFVSYSIRHYWNKPFGAIFSLIFSVLHMSEIQAGLFQRVQNIYFIWRLKLHHDWRVLVLQSVAKWIKHSVSLRLIENIGSKIFLNETHFSASNSKLYLST